MQKDSLMAAVVLMAGLAVADSAIWNNTVANTPDTAYLWSDANNWDGGTKPTSQMSALFNIGSSSLVYIKVDEPVSLMGLSSGDHSQNAFVLGDITICDYSGGSRANVSSAAMIYGDLIFPSELRLAPYFQAFNLCGRIRHLGTDSNQPTMSTGSVAFYFNRYARSAGETRTDDLDDLNYLSVGNGTLTFYAPNATAASTDVWRLTKDSPYATRVTSAPSAVLSAGTTVTCASEGYLGEGVFLKNIFTSDTIELSAPAEASGDVSLTFAAFTPDFRVGFKNRFNIQGASCDLRLIKNSTDAVARIDIPAFRCTYDLCKPTIGSTSSADIPGTFVLHGFDTSSSVVGWANGVCRLYTAHLELAGNGTTGMTVAGEKYPFGFGSANLTTRITVPSGITGKFLKVKEFKGKVVKDGAGTFVMGLASTDTTGKLVVENGTVEIARHETLTGDIQLASLELAAGTTLKIPSTGITVGQLVTQGSVTLSGGPLTVTSAADASQFSAASMTFADGASLVVQRSGSAASAVVESVPQPSVVGHPAFWIDASKTNTMEFANEDGTLYLTRWNDCREGEPMFCTNIVNRPILHVGTLMREKYVRLVNYPSATSYADTDQLVWSVPIGNIKTVFLMHDVTDGGGTILGQCWWRLSESDVPSSWGGAFYRGNYTSLDAKILAGGQYATTAIVNGIFYLDGVRIDPTKTCYTMNSSYDAMHLIEFAINPNYNAGFRRHDLVADAFGGCYKEGTAGVAYANGGQRIAECIVYTNELSYAERLQVAQYLSRKWRDCNIRYEMAGQSFASADQGIQDISDLAVEGSVLEIGDDRAIVASGLTGGAVTKTGNGVLALASIDNTALQVEAGEVKVTSFDESRYLPADTWLHVDAAASDTVITKADGTTLSRWNDKNGLGESLRKSAFAADAKLESNAINGLPAIDLGAPVKTAGWTQSTSSALIYYTADGVISPGSSELLQKMSAPHISTAFLVYDSSPGGGSIMGGFDAGFPSKGLPHIITDTADNAIIDAGSYTESTGHGLYYVHDAIKKGTAFFHQNGVSVDPFSVGFLKGAERVAFRYKEGRVAPVFGGYGQGTMYYGGLKYGEILLYPRQLSDDEVANVEDYLARKWFGIKKSGQAASATTVSVAEGAKLTILGEDFTANMLGGSGEIEGDVELNENGTLKVAVGEDGAMAGTLAIDGDLTLNGGTVILTGKSAKIPAGTYTLVSANKITQAEGASWTIQGFPKRVYQLTITETAILLTVHTPGFTLLMR